MDDSKAFYISDAIPHLFMCRGFKQCLLITRIIENKGYVNLSQKWGLILLFLVSQETVIFA